LRCKAVVHCGELPSEKEASASAPVQMNVLSTGSAMVFKDAKAELTIEASSGNCLQ
jgi:hypothetical protein